MKLQKTGMHNAMQMMWKVKNVTICSYLVNFVSMEKYRERFFTYVLSKPSTWSVVAHLESYHLHLHYTTVLDNLLDDKEVDQLELDWITWQRDYALDVKWNDNRTSGRPMEKQ